MNIIGICAGGHDSSAALIVNGEVVCAISEERLDRVKHSRSFPWLSIQACMDHAGLSIHDIDCLALGWNFERFIKELYLKPALDDMQHFEYLARDAEKLNSFLGYEELLRDRLGFKGDVKHCNHHDCHTAYAFHTSDFEEANLLSMDGYGEIETTLLGHATRVETTVFNTQSFPNSLGLTYAALTYYLGFIHHCDEGIVMGLASYGDPSAIIPGAAHSYADVFNHIIQSDGAGGFQVSDEWLTLGLMRGEWVKPRFIETFGPVRLPGSELTDHHMNIAAALQQRVEDIGCELARYLKSVSPSRNLCLSGGLALNCVMNTRIQELGIYDEVYIPSAPADNGNAIGAAILAYLERHPTDKIKSLTFQIGFGPEYDDRAIAAAAQQSGVKVTRPENLLSEVADWLHRGYIVGYFCGRSEFGPRALGNRSILTRPAPSEMKDILNSRVKFREYFRPFAPVVPSEDVKTYFQTSCASPHMMHAFRVQPDRVEEIAATVHVDQTCRVQTVHAASHPRFHALLREFEKRSGIPVILNTSFNVKGQPIVETPREAVDCFLSTNIDILALEDYLLIKDSVSG